MFKVCLCEDPVHLTCLDEWRFTSRQFGACPSCKGEYTQVVRTDISFLKVAWGQVPPWHEAKAGAISAVKTHVLPFAKATGVLVAQIYVIFWMLGVSCSAWNVLMGTFLVTTVICYSIVAHVLLQQLTQGGGAPEHQRALTYFWHATPLMLLVLGLINGFGYMLAYVIHPTVSLVRRIHHERLEVEGHPVF